MSVKTYLRKQWHKIQSAAYRPAAETALQELMIAAYPMQLFDNLQK